MDRRFVALFAALVLTAAVAVVPVAGLSTAGQYALATMVFAAVLWVTEGLPLPVTALCIPILLTVFGVYDGMRPALSGFTDPVVFLLLGGFVLAAALQAYDIDRRIAYRLLVVVGTSPRRLVFGVMVATALLSMLISNTATAAMMAPIAVGIAAQVSPSEPAPATPATAPSPTATTGAAGTTDDEVDQTPARSNLHIAMLLGVAYAASLGGLGTLVGSPPNAIVVTQLERTLGVRITFVDWLLVGLPLVVVSVPLAWLLLVRLYPPVNRDVAAARAEAREALGAAGPLDPMGKRVLAVAGGTAALWLLGGFDTLFESLLPPRLFTTLFGGTGPHLFGGPGHQGVLFFALVGLLAVPALVLTGAVDWDDVSGIDWGTLVLLGGGISLADALAATGAIAWLADRAVETLAGTPVVLVVLVVVAATVLLSELASNTAMAAVLAPLLIATGPVYAGALGVDGTTAAVFLAVTGGVAGSFGFALPVATPPNAIVFGTGEVGRTEMLRAGTALDVIMILVGTALLFALFTTVWPLLFGVN